MQETIRTIPVAKKKRRLSKPLIITLMAALAVMACATVMSPAVADRAHTFSGVSGEENASSIVTTLEQALGIIGGSVTEASAGRIIVNDEYTAFKAPAEACIGDQFKVNLALVNRSDQPLDLELDINTLKGFSVDVKGRDGVTNVVRTDINSFAFTLAASEDNEAPDLAITVAVDDLTQPGNYTLDCSIEPLRF